MDTENKPFVVEDNVVVTMNYSLSIDGEVVDSSEGEDNDPIIFLQGAGQIISGLEKSIYGLKIGDKKSVTIDPKDGYGDIDPESIVEVPKDEFPKDFPLELGVEITVNADDEDEEGEEEMEATIVAVNESTVTLDFNHPLAGKTLNFDVHIIDIREATSEEIEHGHVHGDDSEFYFEDEDFDELDEEDETNHHH
ncbi:MAG: peptidylprolyl isomerase [Chloroflexi bacterium HGW-Chloroflexi-3]|nr:MAG: peptidylprolyl isomerase [Chloroflexi bacterium HGW-Chloroflexi-3]